MTPPASTKPTAPTPAPTPGHSARLPDLEIKDAQLIFEAVWQELEADVGRENLRFPKEIILLGGAPGAGKGTNTAFIARARGLTCPPIVISALLDTPEAKRIKDAGGMVGDREVVGLLLRRLLRPEFRDGVILDGFPRTKVQVECLKLLIDRMHQLRHEFYRTPVGIHFRQPTVHIMVLFVDEKTSIARQLNRGRVVRAHNEEVRRSGMGELQEERATDYDEELARRRYRVFKEETWGALQSLKEIFHYHFINAQGTIDEVEQNILQESQYQSTLELDPQTHDRLRHAISGLALVNTEDLLLEDPLALAMLIDVFSERGYHAIVDLHRIEVPEKVDLTTGLIQCRVKKVFRLQIRFQGSEIRRG